MIGNLCLKFKKGILKNNVYKEEDLKEYDIKLVVGLYDEEDLYYYVDNYIYDILEAVGIKHSGEVECIFNLDYYFNEIVEDENPEDICLDYDFRECY